MRQFTFSDTYNGVKFSFMRINKKSACKAFKNGLPVVFCPVNMRPGGPWHPEAVIDPARIEEYDRDFVKVLNAFDFYNCRDNETGKYTAFYIPVNVETIAGTNIPKLSQLNNASYDYDFINAVR